MKSIAYRLKGIVWYQWVLAVCVFLYLIYLSLSWFYLPGKLKRVTEADVSSMIGREISVEKIKFNPFILSLSAEKFYIADKSEEPLVAWDQLQVNFSLWKSVFSWGIALDGLKLDNPRINIVKDKKGFNFSDIIDRLSAPDPKNSSTREKAGNSKSIALKIFNTSINMGSFMYTDNSGIVTAGTDLNDISLKVDELYFATGDEHLNPFNLKASGQKGSQIQLAGSYRVHPLYVEGKIKAEGLDLAGFSGFLENILPARLSRGTLSFNINILAKKEAGLTLKTDRGNLSITDLLLDDNVPDPAMLSAGNINVQDFSIDLTGRKVLVENVLLDNIILNQWIDKEGRLRYRYLLSEKIYETIEDKNVSVETERTEPPWDIMVKQVSIKNSTTNFDDQNENITRGHSLSGMNLDLKDISLAPESKIPVQLAAMLDENGAINVDGSMCLSPLSVELNYRLDKILLNPFSEYLEASSWLSIEDGSLSVDGKVSISEGVATSISASASLGLDDFKLKDSRSGNPVFGLKSFKLDDIKAEVDKRNVSIASVSVLKPDFNLSMSEDKAFNLSGLMKGDKIESVPEAPVKESDKSTKWKFEIEKVSLNDGTLLFTDKSIKPEYKTGFYNMSFSMDRFGSDIKESAPFSFKTEIDKYAPFNITGSLDPVEKQPGFDFKSMLKGLEMPHLSPYSGVYIGNNLKSGKLSLNLDYTLHDRKIKGRNNINAKNLYLGEKLPVEPVVNAPVGLGLALLRDMSGVIDLNVGISGDLDDPGFSVSGVIVKALVNIIVKAAASPFKLLGALIPGGDDDLGEIKFEPGNSALNQKSKESLKNLVDALDKRPQLILSIKGNASGPEDIEAMKIAGLKQLVSEKRNISISVLEEELKIQDFWMIAENRPVLGTINNEKGLTPVAERMEKLNPAADTEKTGNPDDAPAPDTGLREESLFKQIYDDIVAAVNVEESELISLADERALSIKQHLVDDLKLGHERVSVIKSRSSDLSGRVIELGLGVM